jgi:hypothetical protein
VGYLGNGHPCLGNPTESCRIVRNGTVIATNVPCRLHNARLFTETPDPQDANVRSMAEWGWTLPLGTDVDWGDYIELSDGSLSTIAGEVLKWDTWATAIRVWATRPKVVVRDTQITLVRPNDTNDDLQIVGTYWVNIIYDRNQPEEVPIRFSPQGHTLSKGGIVIGDLAFPARSGDLFEYSGLQCRIEYVLPGQPQHIEARFTADISGVR